MMTQTKKDTFVGVGMGLAFVLGGLIFRVQQDQAPEVGYMIMIVGVILIAWGGYSFVKDRRDGTASICVKCGYDLRGSSGTACPECGEPVAQAPGGAANQNEA